MTSPHSDSAVAIIGMACRLPGAKDIDQFWKLVRERRTAWGPAPESRFDRELYFHPQKGTLNKSYSDLAAVIEYQPIDRAVCPISDAAVALHDISHLTLCEVASAACRHAGLDPLALSSDNTGVYVGHAAASGAEADLSFATYIAQTAKYLRESVGFEQLSNGLGEQLIQEIVESVRCVHANANWRERSVLGASLAARLIADTLSLSGPCMSFNAACASSSRALAQAMRALQLRTIDMAIVGGASFFQSDTLVLFSQSQALSATGSYPFTANADGMVAGEGYVVLIMKMLGQALHDNDRILAVLPSIGVSSDGHGKSLWAPRYEGQVKAIQRAYGPNVSMAQLQYIEAHATSTAVGDVTEVKALTAALEGQIPGGRKVPVGSAKLNVGHTLESAGLVGVLKTVLALQHEVIPPAIGDLALNPDIDWERAAVYVPREEIAWPKSASGIPRRAGVNSFGIGGLNVHAVVDEYVPSRSRFVSSGFAPAKTSTTRAATRADDAIAIIGMGAVMPGALSREAFWELLTSGRDPKIEVPSNRWDAEAFHRPGGRGPWETPTKLGGFITGFEYDWRKHKIPPKQIQQASPLQFMILDAVDQAIQQARYHERPFDRQQVGVVVGTVFGGDYAAQLLMGLRLPDLKKLLAELLRSKRVDESLIARLSQSYGEVLLKEMPALLDETGSFTASALASRITKSFDLMGGAVAIDAGQASSLAALSCCVDQLRAGDCDMMICVGGQNDMTPRLYADLSAMGALATGVVRSPFDVRAQGTVPGEGCGAVLLKRLADARRDHDPIFGIIRGIGAAYDRSPAEATRQAVGRALKDAGLAPADVSAIEMTPSGQLDVDAAEIQGIVDSYRDRLPEVPLLLGTLVGQIGDISGGAGMATLLKGALDVETVEMPAAFSLHQTAAHITRHSAVLTVPTKRTRIPANKDGRLIAGVHTGGKSEVSYHVLIERGTELNASHKTTPSNGQPTSAQPSAGGGSSDRIIEFDATLRRRERNRSHAVVAKAPPQPTAMPAQVDRSPVPSRPLPPTPRPTAASIAPPRQPAPASPVKPTARPMASPSPSAAVKSTPPQASHSPLKSNGAPTPSPAPIAAPAPETVSATPSQLNAQELEKFLINFVVEQTGYPPEIVELDANLEADLGIDSIKKAQLFGELAEYFDVQPAQDVSLDDFPTLRHVLAVLLTSQSRDASTPAPAAHAPVKSNGAPIPAADPTKAPEPVAEAAPSQLNAQELEKFLINFVVEQTGYPPEIVELDANLEADLGIDSIKKAQLFGELAEYFDVQPAQDVSLDDFPTLRHVLAVLLTSQSRDASTPAPAAHAPVKSNGAPIPAADPTKAPEPVAEAAPSQLNAQELEKFLINFVVEQTGYPPEIVELDANLEADLGIDSIKKAQLFGELAEYFDVQPAQDVSLDDFPTLRHVLAVLLTSQSRDATTPAPAAHATVKSNGAPTSASAPIAAPQPEPVAEAAPSQLNAQELEKFLINFVVEQTGYPPEIVELDANLEADLGIDSIKKAQLFGELAEYFDVQPAQDVSLDDFPTLRHVLAVLLTSQSRDAAIGR